MFLDSPSLVLLEKASNGLWERQKTISNNIANVDTPNYKSKKVEFEEYLKNAVGDRGLFDGGNIRYDSRSEISNRLKGTSARVYTPENTITRLDQSNVDPDAENIELLRTEIQESYVANQLTNNFARLRMAIRLQ